MVTAALPALILLALVAAGWAGFVWAITDHARTERRHRLDHAHERPDGGRRPIGGPR